MFDIGIGELLVIIIIAVVVIGPKDLPLAMRTAGRWIGKMRRISAHFRSGIDTMVREAELEDMEKKWKAQNEEIMRRSAALTEAEAGAPVMTAPPRLKPRLKNHWRPPRSRKPLPRPAIMFKVEDLDETRAPLLDHLIELRTRVIRALLALAVGFGVCLYFADDILGVLVFPLKQAFPDGEGQLIFTKLPEVFFVELKVALFAGFMVSFPVIANQLWAFIAPGLYAREKKAFLPFLFATPLLFGAGAALAYFVVMPTAFRFFLDFGGETGGMQVQALPSAGEYLSLVMQFILGFGVTFLLPVLLLLLHRAGIVSRAQMAGARRYVIVGIFIIAAIVTPPDPGSQVILAVPLWLLFEASLVLMRLQEKAVEADRLAREAEEAAEKVAAE